MFSVISKGHCYPLKWIAKLRLFFGLAKHRATIQIIKKLKILRGHYISMFYNRVKYKLSATEK